MKFYERTTFLILMGFVLFLTVGLHSQPVTAQTDVLQDYPYHYFLPLIAQGDNGAKTSPGYTTSLYISTLDGATIYNYGCALGSRDQQTPGTQDSLVILDFGQPWEEDGTLGVWSFSWQFIDTNRVYDLTKEYIRGYYNCTGSDNASRVDVAIGTSNYGSKVTSNHGKAWAGVVDRLYNWTISSGYSSQVTVSGAIDIELSWNTPSISKAWVDGYDSADKGKYLRYNFGACEGCPTRLATGLTPANGWKLSDIYYTAYGAAPVWPIPEIYATSGVNARQWAYLSYWSYYNKGTSIYYRGLMTQWQACQQYPGKCEGTDNSPSEGWTQLFGEINYWSVTAQSTIPWLTDIKWEVKR